MMCARGDLSVGNLGKSTSSMSKFTKTMPMLALPTSTCLSIFVRVHSFGGARVFRPVPTVVRRRRRRRRCQRSFAAMGGCTAKTSRPYSSSCGELAKNLVDRDGSAEDAERTSDPMRHAVECDVARRGRRGGERPTDFAVDGEERRTVEQQHAVTRPWRRQGRPRRPP